MMTRLTGCRPLMIAVLAAGLIACNNPTLEHGKQKTSQDPGNSWIENIDRLEQADLAANMLTPRGQVWFNGDREVVGIIFLTARGDLFVSKDGVHSCFIRTESERSIVRNATWFHSKEMP